MKISDAEIKQYQQQALYYCNMALDDMDKMSRQYELDCKTEKIDIAGYIIVPRLADIYYSVKKGIMSREQAIQKQKELFNLIEIED